MTFACSMVLTGKWIPHNRHMSRHYRDVFSILLRARPEDSGEHQVSRVRLLKQCNRIRIGEHYYIRCACTPYMSTGF